jgi:multiple sugar transport system ATP-binding protein
MNLLPGVARRGGVEVDGRLLPAEGASLADGRAVVYGVRPEHLDLVDPAGEGFPATVAVVEPTGAETLVYLRFAGADVVAVFRDRHDLAPGQVVHLRPRPDKAHLFDPESGVRL